MYAYGTSRGFPSCTFIAINYWVACSRPGSDRTRPADGDGPDAGQRRQRGGTNTAVTATFSEAMNPASITGATFELRDAGNTLVPAAVTYNAGTNTATLTPNAALGASTTYTATVKGGTSGVKDAAGNALAVDAGWTFSTAAADVTPPTVTGRSPASGATGVARPPRSRPPSARR